MALLGQTFPIKCIASGADGGEGRRMQRVFALIFPEPRNSSRGNDCWDSSFRILQLEYIACVSWELTDLYAYLPGKGSTDNADIDKALD